MICYYTGLIILGISVGFMHGIPVAGATIGIGFIVQAATASFIKVLRRG